MNKPIIPVMHCFNNNYVIPAAASFLSMLQCANTEYEYKLYVLHDDITEVNQKRLTRIIDKFDNATLEFINTNGQFKDLYGLREVSNFSKEMFYKLVAPRYFKDYEKIIITDVDVIFADDISKTFVEFDIDDGPDKDNYLAGNARNFEYFLHDNRSRSKELLQVNAGYMIFNLKKMRTDNMEEKFLDYAYRNIKELKNPEQDVLNTCCYPHIKVLPAGFLISALNSPNKKFENPELNNLWEDVKNHPVQIHFAEYNGKPWKCPDMPFFFEWLSVLKETDFYSDYTQNIREAVELFDACVPVARFKIPFRNRFLLFFRTMFKQVRVSKTLRTR